MARTCLFTLQSVLLAPLFFLFPYQLSELLLGLLLMLLLRDFRTWQTAVRRHCTGHGPCAPYAEGLPLETRNPCFRFERTFLVVGRPCASLGSCAEEKRRNWRNEACHLCKESSEACCRGGGLCGWIVN